MCGIYAICVALEFAQSHKLAVIPGTFDLVRASGNVTHGLWPRMQCNVTQQLPCRAVLHVALACTCNIASVVNDGPCD